MQMINKAGNMIRLVCNLPGKSFSSLCIDQGSANSPGFQDDPPLLRTSKSDLYTPPSLERARGHPNHRQHRSPYVLEPCLRF